MSEIAQIQGQIANAETQVADMMTALDSAMAGVSSELAEMVSAWMNDQYMANYKRRAAEGAAESWAEGVPTMKRELQELLNRVPGLAEDALGDEQEAPHRRVHRAGGSGAAYNVEEAGWEFIRQAFNEAITPLGELLNRHGHIDLSVQRIPKHGWALRSGEVFRESSVHVERRTFTVFAAYLKGVVELRSKLDSMKSLRSQLAQAQAVDLWNKAG